jgi:protein involved in polysaccharide export with SLBB domain
MSMRILLTLCALCWILPADSEAQQEALPAVQTAAGSHLSPGDVIRLRVWREETITGEYRVDADGTVVFPRLGPMRVTEVSPAELKAELQRQYARYLRDPAIEVLYLRRVLIGGAVFRPAVYYIDPTMTIRDALLEAGGATPAGRMDRIELIRDGVTVEARLREDLTVVESPVRSGDQLYVPEKSWLARNTSVAVGIGGALLSFAATMIILIASR